MHIAELIASIIFLYMKIFVCLIKQARLLAIISKLGGVTIAFYGWASLNKNEVFLIGFELKNSQPMYTLAGIDLTTHKLPSGDDTTR
jgi:hypothetical protein